MMRPVPSLKALHVFEAVSRHLNFRLAAEELGVTQGAVAQQIRGLEDALGLKLFDRHPRTLSLTEAGRAYIPSIARAFELIREATSLLRPSREHVTISVTPSFASKWLIPRLGAFTEANPDVDVRIVATDRISDFHAEEVDLAVRLTRPPFPTHLSAVFLLEHVVLAVGSPLLIEKLGDPEIPSNFARYALLHDAHTFWPKFLKGRAHILSITDQNHLRFNQTALAIDAAVAGQGLALAGSILVADDLASGRLVQIGEECLIVDTAFYLVAAKGSRESRALKVFRDWLTSTAAGYNRS